MCLMNKIPDYINTWVFFSGLTKTSNISGNFLSQSVSSDAAFGIYIFEIQA